MIIEIELATTTLNIIFMNPNIIDPIFINGKISHYFALFCRCLGAMPVVLVVLTALPTPFVRVVNL